MSTDKAYSYTGGPVWAAEWCPKPYFPSEEEGDSEDEELLAVASDFLPGPKFYVCSSTETPQTLLQFWTVRKAGLSNAYQER